MIATGGDTHLGGDDIDNLLIAIALDDIAGDAELGAGEIAAKPTGELVQAVRKAVIEAKISLSDADSAKIELTLPNGKRYAREITRRQFDELTKPVIARTAGPRSPGAEGRGTEAGADRRSCAGRRLNADFPRCSCLRTVRAERAAQEAAHGAELDELVGALGAAVQAQILAGGLGCGLEAPRWMTCCCSTSPLRCRWSIKLALGGVVAKVIQRNSTIPASATEHFTTLASMKQTNVAIHVLQGERELAKDCRSLARFDLKGIPPMVAGLPRIEVKFLIDAKTAFCTSRARANSEAGKEADIEVKPT